ncbi:MAG: GGDEF domain-containing protein [Solirubrobacterales bacterium]
MKIKFREYISRNMNFVAYAIICILVFFTFTILLSIRINNSMDLAEESLHSVAMKIDGAARTAVDHTVILRDEAQINLNEPPVLVPNKLFSSLSQNPSGGKFELRNIPKDYNMDMASYILGGGDIPEHSSERAQEIEASIKLNSLFADIKHNIPQVTWVYYYSANRFINMYPFENQYKDFIWSDDYMVHPLFVSVQPNQDPDRSIKWFKAYIDEAGKGLMTSILAPVYDAKNQFRGMVGMDFTLETMKGYLNATELEIGTPFLVNQQGQVMAHPSEIHPDDKTVKELSEVLPADLKVKSEDILKLQSKKYNDFSRWKIYVLDMDGTPWRLFFIVSKKQLLWNTIAKMWAEIIGVLLMLVVVGILEQRNRISEKLRTYKAAVDSSSAAIIITDRHRRIQYVNKSFEDITGYSKQEVIGGKDSFLKQYQTQDEVNRELVSALDNNKSWKGELLYEKKDKTMLWVNMLISPVIGNKEDGCYIAVMEDVTEHKHMLEALNKLATIDGLTNIANRPYFLSIAENEFKRTIRYNKNLSVLMLDIDHFKKVNDTFGHGTGDIVLKNVAAKCSEIIRLQDCAGRLGGEEFAILLPETDKDNAIITAERIRAAIELMETDTSDGHKIKVTCSIGVTEIIEGDTTFDLMLSRADTALYEAKNTGRNKIVEYSEF